MRKNNSCNFFRLKILLLLSIAFTFTLNSMVFAKENENIRVGLESKYKEKIYISVKNNDIIVGYDLHNDINNGMNMIGNDFKIIPSNNYYVMLPNSYHTYYDAQNESSKYTYNKIVGVVDINKYGVVLGPFEDKNEADDVLNTVSSGYVISDKEDLMTLYDGEIPKLLFTNNLKQPQIADGMEGNVKLSSTDIYRGVIEFLHKENNTVTPVNIVNREYYLYSVVPSEMPKSWEMEALKAQSLAARTYSIVQSMKHSDDGYDVCDQIHCQVYTGVINEDERTTKAVDETYGEVIYYQDAPIDAVFYSSSGGSTVNSEDAWTATVPYLRNVLDNYETTSLQWERDFTFSELNEIAEKKGVTIGEIFDVSVTSQSDFGRTTSITLYGTGGEYTLEGETMRTFFSVSDDGSLKSTNFVLEKGENNKTTSTVITEVTDVMVFVDGISVAYKTSDIYVATSTSDNTEYIQLDEEENMHVIGAGNVVKKYGKNVIENNVEVAAGDSISLVGKGWGHGVGLSQHGANGMAKSGYNYAEIVNHYYTNIMIKNIY